MNPLDPRHRRKCDQGLELADSLLEACRPLDPLPPAAHARVKRRLEARAVRKTGRAFPWLQVAVVGITMLVCGAAFGIAIDRLVLKRQVPTEDNGASSARSSRASHGKWKKPSEFPGPNGESPTAGQAEQQPASAASVVVGAPSSVALAPPSSAPTSVPLAPALGAPALGTEPAAASSAAATVQGAPPSTRRIARKAESAAGSSGPPVQEATSALTHSSPEKTAPAAAIRKLALRDLEPTNGLTFQPLEPPSELEGSVAAAAPSPHVPRPAPATTSAPAGSPAGAVIPSQPATSASAPASPVPPSEEKLLATAVRALRAEKDAASALVALDRYMAHYQHGRLAAEASILRVDAMIALGRRDDALRMLDGLDLSRVPGGVERQLQRGELRAGAGRWLEARADYEGVLSRGSERDGGLLERACAGRVEAWQHLGNREQARRAAAEYLSRFPRGRFSAQARLVIEAAGHERN
jgi:hypothetical protein